MLVKLELAQSELGMSAGRLRFSWYLIHQMNTGTEATLRVKRMILDARRMLWMSEDNILPLLVHAQRHAETANSYARTYDKVVTPVVAITVPTQSISENSRFPIDCSDRTRISRGKTQTPIAHMTKLKAPAR